MFKIPRYSCRQITCHNQIDLHFEKTQFSNKLRSLSFRSLRIKSIELNQICTTSEKILFNNYDTHLINYFETVQNLWQNVSSVVYSILQETSSKHFFLFWQIVIYAQLSSFSLYMILFGMIHFFYFLYQQSVVTFKIARVLTGIVHLQTRFRLRNEHRAVAFFNFFFKYFSFP